VRGLTRARDAELQGVVKPERGSWHRGDPGKLIQGVDELAEPAEVPAIEGQDQAREIGQGVVVSLFRECGGNRHGPLRQDVRKVVLNFADIELILSPKNPAQVSSDRAGASADSATDPAPMSPDASPSAAGRGRRSPLPTGRSIRNVSM